MFQLRFIIEVLSFLQTSPSYIQNSSLNYSLAARPGILAGQTPSSQSSPVTNQTGGQKAQERDVPVLRGQHTAQGDIYGGSSSD
jgi:hypothetical protein